MVCGWTGLGGSLPGSSSAGLDPANISCVTAPALRSSSPFSHHQSHAVAHAWQNPRVLTLLLLLTCSAPDAALQRLCQSSLCIRGSAETCACVTHSTASPATDACTCRVSSCQAYRWLLWLQSSWAGSTSATHLKDHRSQHTLALPPARF